MFAAVVTVTIDPAQTDASLAMLNDMVVPTVKASAGFVAGYWLQPVDGRSTAMVVFDTEANARAAAPPVGPTPGTGVVVVSVDFSEVAASA
jgi:hypothetical protein